MEVGITGLFLVILSFFTSGNFGIIGLLIFVSLKNLIFFEGGKIGGNFTLLFSLILGIVGIIGFINSGCSTSFIFVS
jgi:hypothetical protein